ncbi:MAG TPA: hypothetical protein VGM05_25690 [Planctomycetaceae bacterium]|jgi:hypothetical protein
MPELLYRVPFDAADLVREHPPQFRHPHKGGLFEVAYPNGAVASSRLEVTQWKRGNLGPLTLTTPLAIDVQPNFYDYAPVGDSPHCVEWHVNFADPRLFAAYGSSLFAQDEMQVAEHPLLGSVREALLARGLDAMTRSDSGSTPILIRNVERRIEVQTNADASAGRPAGLYGNLFAAANFETIRKATRRIDPPSFTNIIAIAAPVGGRGEYSDSDIDYVLQTAVIGFSAAREESARFTTDPIQIVVHSGFWGCGAFGGNRRLMIALQVLSAHAAEIDRIVFHAGTAAGVEEVQRGIAAAESLATRCGSPCSLNKLVGRCSLLGYRWGVSDGN